MLNFKEIKRHLINATSLTKIRDKKMIDTLGTKIIPCAEVKAAGGNSGSCTALDR